MFHYSIRIETNNLAIILIIKIMKKKSSKRAFIDFQNFINVYRYSMLD